MAIIAQFETPHGITLPAAYVRLEDVRQRNIPFKAANPINGHEAVLAHTMGFALAIVHASASARESGKPAVESIGFTYFVDTSEGAPSLIAQAYQALAARPDFIDPVNA